MQIARSSNPSQHLLSAAHAVALNARLGRVDRDQVANLSRLAGGLDSDDPQRRMVDAFYARHRLVFRDPVALSEAGDDLLRDVLRALRPAPVGAGRVDIHG